MANDDHPDPRKPIAQAIAKSVGKILSPDLEARYQKELDQREAANKRVIVLGFVAQADKILALTPDQRLKFGKILDEKMERGVENSKTVPRAIQRGQYLPTMPERDQ